MSMLFAKLGGPQGMPVLHHSRGTLKYVAVRGQSSYGSYHRLRRTELAFTETIP